MNSTRAHSDRTAPETVRLADEMPDEMPGEMPVGARRVSHVRAARPRRTFADVVFGALVALALTTAGAPRRAAHAGDDPKYPQPQPPPPAPSAADLAHVAVKVKVDDTVTLAGTYASNGAKPGAPALLLVHGEDQTRFAWAPLWGALDEVRVPWLSIDLRGHGESREQGGKDLATLAAAKDPALFASLSDDVAAGVRFLVEKGHDKEKIGVLASQLGAAAALRLAHEHKEAVASLMLMTPTTRYPGFTSEKDAADTNGKMDFVVLASVEDLKKAENEKSGPLRILYTAEAARNAPPETPLDERIKRRRGIPPRFRAFREMNVTGTEMIAGVPHFDAWLGSWWARRLGTYPHPVLYDGSVDVQNDYADPEWAFGTDLPSRAGKAKALRWGRRLMVSAALPKNVRSIHLRVHATRGDHQIAGQFARIEYPTGVVTATPIVRGFGRAPSTETSALVLEPEEIPEKVGRETVIRYGDPSFETESRLPELPGDGPYVVRVAWAISRGESEPEDDEKYKEDDPTTWTVVPDLLAGTGLPYVPPDDTPTAPGRTAGPPKGPFGDR